MAGGAASSRAPRRAAKVGAAAALGALLWRQAAVARPGPGLVLGRRLPASLRHAVSRRRAEAGDSRRQALGPEELLDLLQRPSALEDLKEIGSKLRADPSFREKYNATLSYVESTASGADVGDEFKADPFVRLLATDADSVASELGSAEGRERLLAGLNSSALFEDLSEFGGAVFEQMQVARLEAGAPVEISGLVGRPELNGQVALLAEPLPEEVEANPDRRVVVLQTGERVALRPVCLGFPSHRLGDAVTLETEFAGEEEGLEGRAAVVSELTEEERELGLGRYGGRVVVDVLPLVPGGPVVNRLLMWPEHLMPRRYVPGDNVELRGLESAASLNGAAATVVPPSAEEASTVQSGGGERRVIVSLDADGTRLAVRKENLLLVSGDIARAPSSW